MKAVVMDTLPIEWIKNQQDYTNMTPPYEPSTELEEEKMRYE